MIDFAALMSLKQNWEQFKNNHPKIGPFINNVKTKTACEGQEIAIAIRYPDGTEYKTGIRVTSEDLALLDSVKRMF